MLRVGRDRGAVGQPRQPDQQHDIARVAAAAPRRVSRSASTDHSSRSSRPSVSAGFSSTSTEPAAPSAQRPPRWPARRLAGRRASGRRRHGRRRARKGSRWRSRQQPQRPADRLQLERQPSLPRPRSGEPAGEAVVARRTPLPQHRQRAVGLLDHRRRGVEWLREPRRLDPRWWPRATGENSCLHRHRDTVPSRARDRSSDGGNTFGQGSRVRSSTAVHRSTPQP